MFEALQGLDGNILLWLQEYVRTDFLTPVFRFITKFGDKGLFWIGVCLVLLLLPKYRELGVPATMSLVLNALLTNVIIKNVVARVRPYERIEELVLLADLPHDFSFPSGHTAASFAVASAIYLAGYKRAGTLALVFAALIGFSRLYLGVHYPTDVLGGMVVGVFSAWAVRKFWDHRAEKTAGQ